MAKQGATPDDVLDSASVTAISEALKPNPLTAERKESMRARILDRINTAIPAPEGTITVRADERGWIAVTPLIDIKVLYRDIQQNAQTMLWRVQPGASVPPHYHHLTEECLVLEGEIKVGDHTVRQGDMHIALAGHTHPMLESPTGALLLLRAEIQDWPTASP
jgi:quercetin dioxygenase-like cupin family protein